MTINTTLNRTSAVGNGAATGFSFPYLFNVDADLKVIKTITLTGVETLQVIVTDYTVTGAGNPAGGTVTFGTAPLATESVIIYRDPPMTQLTDLVQGDKLPADTLEATVDKLTMIVQRLSDRTNRLLGLSDGDPSLVTFTMPTPEALKIMQWNALGTELQNIALPTGGSGTNPVYLDWTPRLVDLGDLPNLYGITYTTQVANSVKIGNFVKVWGTISLSSKGTMPNSAQLGVGDLPYTPVFRTGQEYTVSVGAAQGLVFLNQQDVGGMLDSSDYISLRDISNATLGGDPLTAVEMNGSVFRFNFETSFLVA